jgi:hypothetical protein
MNSEQVKAYSIDSFCKAYSIGRTKVYEEIKQGRLIVTKAGKKSLISAPAAEQWLNSLPKMGIRT